MSSADLARTSFYTCQTHLAVSKCAIVEVVVSFVNFVARPMQRQLCSGRPRARRRIGGNVLHRLAKRSCGRANGLESSKNRSCSRVNGVTSRSISKRGCPSDLRQTESVRDSFLVEYGRLFSISQTSRHNGDSFRIALFIQPVALDLRRLIAT